MQPIKIAISIPTYNRVEKLKFALEKIEQQVFDRSGVDLTCVISNSCSDDGTEEFLRGLKSSSVNYIVANPAENAGSQRRYVHSKENSIRAINSVPEGIEWIWVMGDDDYLVSRNAVDGFANLLRKHGTPRLSLIHLCQARRSRQTGEVLKGTVFELCNRIGFHEMLGWMSSIVVKRARAIEAYNGEMMKNSQSAFSHSAALLEVCHGDDAVFADTAWVDPQDAQQTTESIERWKKEKMGERYFHVVDDMERLYSRGTLRKRCEAVFFRYHTYFLWDRYLSYLIGDALSNGGITAAAREHWQRLQRLAALLADPVQQKLLSTSVAAVLRQTEHLTRTHNDLLAQKEQLVATHKQLSIAVFPFSNLLKT